MKSNWLLGLIVVLAGAYWSLQYQPYVLPNSDFFRIQAMAQQFATLQMPDDFKQMPLVPILMLPLAALLPVDSDAYLHALSILNIALSMANLVLLFLLSSVFLRGTVALVPVILLLASPQFTVSAHQPMLEPTIGFFTLATLLTLARRPSWAYALAGAAALTRYELAVLLPVVFIVQTLRSPSDWFRIGVRTAIASVPFVIWFGASVIVPAEGNTYFDDIVRASPIDVAANMLTPLPGRAFMLAMIIVGWSIGLAKAYTNDRATTLAIVAFFGLYALAHLFYGRPLERYSYTVLWVVPLFATVGFHQVGSWVASMTRGVAIWSIVGTAFVGWGVVLASWLRAARIASARVPMAATNDASWYVGWATVWVVLIIAAVALNRRGAQRRAGTARMAVSTAFAAIIVTTPLVLAGGNLSHRMVGVYYDKAELAIVLEWLSGHTAADTRVVMSRYHALRDDMPTIAEDRVVPFSSFDAETHEAFVAELDARDIEYVVFLYRPERPTDESRPLYGRNMANYLRDRVYLMDPFRTGARVPGFERLATLDAPHPHRGHASHVYRRIPPLEEIEAISDD